MKKKSPLEAPETTESSPAKPFRSSGALLGGPAATEHFFFGPETPPGAALNPRGGQKSPCPPLAEPWAFFSKRCVTEISISDPFQTHLGPRGCYLDPFRSDFRPILDHLGGYKCWVGTRLMRNEPQTCTPQRMLGGDASREIPYGSLWKYPETLRELGLTISLHRAPGNQW